VSGQVQHSDHTLSLEIDVWIVARWTRPLGNSSTAVLKRAKCKFICIFRRFTVHEQFDRPIAYGRLSFSSKCSSTLTTAVCLYLVKQIV